MTGVEEDAGPAEDVDLPEGVGVDVGDEDLPGGADVDVEGATLYGNI